MSHRSKRTPITLGAAYRWRYEAALTGGDVAQFHGDCEEPKRIELRGQGSLELKHLESMKDPFVDWVGRREGEKFPRFLPGLEARADKPMMTTVVISVRCRKCPRCLSQKRRQWTAKAIAEVRQASRTWFVTLTVGRDRRLWATMAAMKATFRARNEEWDCVSPVDRTRAIAKVIHPEITRWLKRVRKQSSAPLRYLLVAEAHKDGFPHFHLLVHEMGQPCGERVLRRQWKWGFAQAVLLDAPENAGYVCKYISKCPQTRVRASARYGQLRGSTVAAITEASHKLADARNEVKARLVPSAGSKRKATY